MRTAARRLRPTSRKSSTTSIRQVFLSAIATVFVMKVGLDLGSHSPLDPLDTAAKPDLFSKDRFNSTSVLADARTALILVDQATTTGSEGGAQATNARRARPAAPATPAAGTETATGLQHSSVDVECSPFDSRCDASYAGTLGDWTTMNATILSAIRRQALGKDVETETEALSETTLAAGLSKGTADNRRVYFEKIYSEKTWEHGGGAVGSGTGSTMDATKHPRAAILAAIDK